MGANVPQTTEWLARWRAGDDAALQRLLSEHLPWIRAVVSARLGPALAAREEPADVVQDVVVEFLRYGPRFELQNEAHLRFLLARIAENVLRDRYDYHSRQKRSAERESTRTFEVREAEADGGVRRADEPSDVIERRQWRAWVRLALDLLRPEDREVLVLREWERWDFAQIGAKLGISADSAKMRFHRAAPRLAAQIEQLQRGQFTALTLDDSGADASRADGR